MENTSNAAASRPKARKRSREARRTHSMFLATAFIYPSNGSVMLSPIANATIFEQSRKASSLLLRAHPRVPVGPLFVKTFSPGSLVCALRRN